MTAVTARIKILGRLNVAEKRKPQDGRLKTRTPKGLETELRLSTLPTAFGEKLVMRVFDPEVLVRSFAQLGLTGKQLETWHDLTAHPNGIILVTGPTGSGKTTTLYSTLKQLATEEVNVCTIEDPIEMIEPSFNQMQINASIDLHFADGIRSLMRQDPDIIMVGEIRDGETADMAVQASLTGHLVLSTLHTNDAPSSLTRLHDLGVQPFLTSATILGVMAQRLVRTLCPHCKSAQAVEENSPLAQQWRELVSPWNANLPKQIYHAVGCEKCRNTGYKGRIGLYEIMPMSNELKRLVAQDVSLDDLKRQSYSEGVLPLRIEGAKRVAEGVTTLESVKGRTFKLIKAKNMQLKIISGGQTGVDRGALNASLAMGVPCGGWCPKNREAEDGTIDECYPLTPLDGGYHKRTRQNVIDSNATVLIYHTQIRLGSGTELTLKTCITQKKPYLLIDMAISSPDVAGGQIADFVKRHDISLLNFGGSRGSLVPTIENFTEQAVKRAIELLTD